MRQSHYLRSDFQLALHDQDPHYWLDNKKGTVFRALDNRRTYRFELNDNGFFAKVHRGIGWKAILVDLIRLRKPVLGARNEWRAINKLRELGIDTLTPVAFGETGCNPAQLRSFLVTEELADMTSLETISQHWTVTPPAFSWKKGLIEQLAHISRTLHENGICHRDYYLCHFLVPNGCWCNESTEDHVVSEGQPTASDTTRLYLIDLHRAQLSKKITHCWRVKDLAGLYFSAMDRGLTRHDCYRFIRLYTRLPLRQALATHRRRWQRVVKKAQALYQRMQRKAGHARY